MEAMKRLVASHKEEVKRRKEEKKLKKEMQEPFAIRAKRFVVNTFFIVFYTVFFAAFAYILVVVCTTLIPTTISVILLSLGYSLTSTAEVFLGACAGLFFTAWVFTFSYVIIKKVGGVYWRAVKKRLPKKWTNSEVKIETTQETAVEEAPVESKSPIRMKKK